MVHGLDSWDGLLEGVQEPWEGYPRDLPRTSLELLAKRLCVQRTQSKAEIKNSQSICGMIQRHTKLRRAHALQAEWPALTQHLGHQTEFGGGGV